MAILRNVEKTDTLESQRQKINLLASDVFSIGSGGSDLSTGNLKLGDGTRTAPSLSFSSDATLGIYKPAAKTFGFVSDGKKVADFAPTGFYSFRDLIVQQKILSSTGISILTSGNNYDSGQYDDVPLVGGTGDNATADITVTAFSGIITAAGKNYIEGNYSGIPLLGGSGTGATASFNVSGIEGSITSGGTGYIPGEYTNIALTGGSGSGAIADIDIEGDTILSGSITSPGSGYTEGVYTNVVFVNQPTATITLTAISNPGSPPPSEVYTVNGVTQGTLTFIIGNTYRFNISSSSLSTHPLIFTSSSDNQLPLGDYIVVQKGTLGTSGSFIDIIIKPSAAVGSIKYACSAHSGMGGTINIISGAAGKYGSAGEATVTVNSSGIVSNFEITNSGIDYKQNDVLQVFNLNVGGSGSGFSYTLGASSYTGIVTNVNITNNGINYIQNNILSFNSSSVGGQGTGFQYLISVNPGVVNSLTFPSKGSGYQINDLLRLQEQTANIQTNLKSQVSEISTTLNSSSPVIVVSSTTGILQGMGITVSIGGTGSLTGGTTVLSVDSSTQITLSQNPSISGAATLNFSSVGSLNTIQVSSVQNILTGSTVTKTSGTGELATNTTVTNINTETNTITLSNNPTLAGTATLTFTPSFGVPVNKFEYKILNLGSIESYSITSGGNGYSIGDQLSVDNKSLTQPIVFPVINKTLQTITFVGNVSSSIFSVGDTITSVTSPLPDGTVIYSITSSGGIIQSMLVDSKNYVNGDIITGESVTTSNYTIDTASGIKYRYFINTGSGYQLTPNLTLYVGNTYNFDLSDSSNSSHVFSLSKFRDGIWGPSLIENVSTTLDNTSTTITVTSTTGILAGMAVTTISGTGSLELATTVIQVNSGSNTITLSKLPVFSGSAVLQFRGVEYTQSVTRAQSILSINVSETTASSLYYYCGTQNSVHVDEGGEDNNEALITINQNNPKIFGSNFVLSVSQVDQEDVITANIQTGELTAVSYTGDEATFTTTSVTGTLTAPTIAGTNISATNITSSTNLTLTGIAVNISGNFNIGNSIQVVNTSGNITTSGILKTTNSLNINDKLTIIDTTISSAVGSDIVLTPSTSRVAKINATTAIVIPAGNTSQRPAGVVAQNGAIRFNTQTGQYEGYSASSSSWSSLGGVRDLDGNTYIAAEASIGANDNTLYFYNDANNTLKLTPYEFAFNTVKNVHSLNILAPTSTLWSANSPVTLGQYINYGFNVYEVTTAGTTGGPAVPPTHSTGAVVNGTSTLTWNSSYVDELTFSKISNVNIGTDTIPTKLIINGKLRLFDDTVSTITNDLVLYPYAGKKVTITANSSLVIPAGTTAQRGVPAQGSIRYSSTLSSFEGYNGTNWTSLGGVKDVDGNTYIIPESVPGANENILYFYNNGSNTLKLSTSGLLFDAIDTITSTNNNLDLNVNTVTFNSLAFTIDNTGATSTKLLSTRTNFDFALSSGVTADPLIRLNTTGDILINKTYSTGTDTFVKVLDNELKTFDLDDVKIETFDLVLTKDTTDLGFITIFTPSTHNGAKVVLIANNINTNDREVIEYNVVSKNTDIFHTEYGNVITGADQVNTLFDFDEAGNVRLTSTLSSALTTGNVVNITVIKTIFKK